MRDLPYLGLSLSRFVLLSAVVFRVLDCGTSNAQELAQTPINGIENVLMIGEDDIGCPDKASVVSALKKPLDWRELGMALLTFPSLNNSTVCAYSITGFETTRSAII